MSTPTPRNATEPGALYLVAAPTVAVGSELPARDSDGDDIIVVTDPRSYPIVDYAPSAPTSAYKLLHSDHGHALVQVSTLGTVDETGEPHQYYSVTEKPFTVRTPALGWDQFLGPQAAQLRDLIPAVEHLITSPETDETNRYHDAYEAQDLNAVASAIDAAIQALDTIGADDYWWAHQQTCTAGAEIIALAARDLIGTGDWTQDSYDLITTPWRTQIGSLHPGDLAPVTTATDVTGGATWH